MRGAAAWGLLRALRCVGRCGDAAWGVGIAAGDAAWRGRCVGRCVGRCRGRWGRCEGPLRGPGFASIFAEQSRAMFEVKS